MVRGKIGWTERIPSGEYAENIPELFLICPSLCFGIFTFQSILAVAFNIPPLLSTSEIALDLPCAEELWEAASEEHWASLATTTTNYAFQSSFTNLFNEDVPPLSEPFAGLVLVHALLSQLWQASQCSEDNGKVVLVISRLLENQSNDETPLRVTANGLLNLALVQAQPQAPPKGIVRPHDAAVDIEQVVAYVTSGCQRTPEVTTAVVRCFNALQTGQENWNVVELGLMVYDAG
jgi:hypothetical protein